MYNPCWTPRSQPNLNYDSGYHFIPPPGFLGPPSSGLDWPLFPALVSLKAGLSDYSFEPAPPSPPKNKANCRRWQHKHLYHRLLPTQWRLQGRFLELNDKLGLQGKDPLLLRQLRLHPLRSHSYHDLLLFYVLVVGITFWWWPLLMWHFSARSW